MEKQCELFLSNFIIFKEKHENIESYRFLNIEGILWPSPLAEILFLNDKVRFILRQYLYRNLTHFSMPDSLCDALDAIQTSPAFYISTLIRAVQNPTSRELDAQARSIERALPYVVGGRWNTEYILGPAVSQFSSPEQWCEFKTQLTALSTSDQGWIMRSMHCEASSNLWTTFFFHPEDWRLLVEEELISEAECTELFDSPLGRIFAMSFSPLSLLAGAWGMDWHRSHQSPYPVPLMAILRVVLNVAETVGIHRVSTGEGFDGICAGGRIEAVQTADVEELLRRATRLRSLPSVWVAACLRLSLEAPSLDATILLDFWERHENARPRFIALPGNTLLQDCSPLVGKILDDDRDCALRLAAAITLYAQLDVKVQNRLRDRLAAVLPRFPENNYTVEVGFRALLKLEPSNDELVIWEQLGESVWGHRRPHQCLWELRSRFEKVATWGVSGDRHRRAQLRQRFALFIVQRRQYPPEIARAALEAILQLDGADMPPLEDSDWRMGSI